MATFETISLRDVESSDLEYFYQHQLDPEANRMAAWVSENPQDRLAFNARWDRNLRSPRNINRTILADGRVAGYIACFPSGEDMEVTYWLGREFWGSGVATRALRRMLDLVEVRPILARVAVDNAGSFKVLANCGFRVIGRNKDYANGRGEITEEYILRIDS